MSRILVQNKKVRFNYYIEESYEAGIVLKGSEVKSIRNGKISIMDAYAKNINGEIFLCNCDIAEYDQASSQNHDQKRLKKLLLRKQEIKKIIGKISLKGLTLVAESVYLNDRGFIKVQLSLARGKKLYDKRQVQKDKDWSLDKARIMKSKFRT